MTQVQLKHRIALLLELTAGITIRELETAQPFALAKLWRDSLRLVHQVDELRASIELAMTYLEDGAPETAAARLRAALEAPEVTADDLAQQPADVVTIMLTAAARMTIEAIGRDGEADDATIVRILDTIAPEALAVRLDAHVALLAACEYTAAALFDGTTHDQILEVISIAIAAARGTT